MTMKCACGKKAVYHRRYSGQRFCATCFNRYFERKVTDTIWKYKMMRRGERIAAAISGGKDSTVLLHVLHSIAGERGIELQAITVDEGIAGYKDPGLESAKRNCKELGVPLRTVSFEEEIGYSLDRISNKGQHKPCTYCGVFRRRLLETTARELGADALATGHNLDDEAQAILMNYLTGDMERLHRLNGSTGSQTMIKRVKPLSRLPEKEVMLYALLNKLHFSHAQCPYAKTGYRTPVRDFLNNMESEHPGIKFSIVKGWERITKQHLPEEGALGACTICGQATARNICRACELTEEIKIKMSETN
ncbi:MAG: TIGR00269 family protein [Methanobacteriota archaeon]|nr:MAG: TIGR00269 family protein [Euryarchaeota archaeon]